MIFAPVIWRFLAVFAAIFVVLMVPRLGLTEKYMVLFQKLGAACFTRDDGRREVLFLNSPDPLLRPTFARIEIADRQKLQPDGSGPVRHVDFDVRGLGWTPTALFVSLVLASPVPWSRRLAALGLGVAGVQIVIMGFLALAIWNESSEIGLVSMPPFWKGIVTDWQRNLIALFSLAAPVIIWILVTVRGQDVEFLRKRVFTDPN
jgi:hypothetical protein